MKTTLKIDPMINRLLGMKMKDARGYVGWFEDSKYDDNTKIGDVAFWQEYGTKRGIPQRPFMRPAKLHNEQKWNMLIAQEVRKCIEKALPLTLALQRVGLVVAGDIQHEIRSVYEPPLKESTVKARLRRHKGKPFIMSATKPLVDTGILLGSLGTDGNYKPVRVEEV